MPSPHWPYKERGVEGVHLSPVLCPWVGQMLQSPRQVPLLLERDWPRSAAADVIITRTHLQGALCTRTGFTIPFISHKKGQEERRQHVGAGAQLLPWLKEKTQSCVIAFKKSPSQTCSWGSRVRGWMDFKSGQGPLDPCESWVEGNQRLQRAQHLALWGTGGRVIWRVRIHESTLLARGASLLLSSLLSTWDGLGCADRPPLRCQLHVSLCPLLCPSMNSRGFHDLSLYPKS